MKNYFLALNNRKDAVQISILIFLLIILAVEAYCFINFYQNVNAVNHKAVKEIKKPRIKSAKIVPKYVYSKVKTGNETNELIAAMDGQKVAYLTFDDGPSPNNTPRILDTLKKYDIKATFFIIGKNAEKNPELLIRERDEGHEIAIHSYCHVESIIYKNPEAYLKDIAQCSDIIKNIVGEKGYRNHLIRFPGGSAEVNHGFAEAIAKAGYTFVDWNALLGDAEKPGMMPPGYLMNRLETTAAGHNHVIILMHDAAAKKTTADTLPAVIDYLKAQGFSFKQIPANEN